MEEKYWEKFIMTGKVEDYLSYKMEQNRTKSTGSAKEIKQAEKAGVEVSESDCFNRNGAFRGTGGRI